MKTPDPELRRLTDAWHDGTIKPEQALRLEQRLLTDSGARHHFFEMAELEAALHQSLPEELETSRPRPARTGTWWKAAAVFTLGLFTGWLVRIQDDEPSAPAPRTAARVTGMQGISWDEAPQLQSLSADSPTRVNAGLVELTFASGARALLEGPASFTVTGENAMHLDYGKLVADVPRGAEGFTVACLEGEIVDIGTEFGLEVAPDGRSANFGVFRGEIEYRPGGDASRMIRLLENHAVTAESGRITSIPFIREKFTRKLPSREFAWELSGPVNQTTTLEYDVSHLIWKPGTYRVICKWMRGTHGLVTHGAELFRDGQLVADRKHTGFTGLADTTRANTYEITVSPESCKRGDWTLRLHVHAESSIDQPADSAGVILVEEGLALNATDTDFTGTWEYHHDGKTYHRTFHPDGGASLRIDGKDYSGAHGSRWHVDNGVLVLDIQSGSGTWIRETHLLRNSDTLIFTNRPYRDARKVTGK